MKIIDGTEEITQRKRSVEQIEGINRLMEGLLRPRSLDEKLKYVTDGVVEIFNADFSRIWIVEPGDLCNSGCYHAGITEGPHACKYKDLCLHLRASSGRYTHINGEIHRRVPFGCYKIGRVAAAKDPKFITNDVTNNPQVHDHAWAREVGLTSFAGYRLLSFDEKPVGVLALFSQYSISPDEDALLEGLANTTAQVIQTTKADVALRESRQFLGAVFDSIQDGISVLDSELNIVRVNQAMRKWYAHMLPLEGKKCYQAYHDRSEACEVCPTLRALDSGKLEVDEVPLTQTKGVTGTLELFAFPMLDDSGKPTGVVEYVRDITERKRAEEAIKESAEKIKLFAYSVSHDLKNPTIGINLLTKQLHKKYKDTLDEKGKNYCDQILGASEQLATLVEPINVYISTKEAPLNIERVNLNQVFDTVRDEFAAQMLIRQISWSHPENLLEISVDRLSILRVIRNFVDNALKYGGDELSEIEIGYEESDEFHILSVKDDGIGIAEKDSKKIFSPFERSLTSIGIEGTGLGLAVANEIANQHKGKVWAEFGLENGVVFFISISKDLRQTD